MGGSFLRHFGCWSSLLKSNGRKKFPLRRLASRPLVFSERFEFYNHIKILTPTLAGLDIAYCLFRLFSARLARRCSRTSMARLRWQLELRQSTFVTAPETLGVGLEPTFTYY